MAATGLMAQDPHFSQFYYSPLTLNPALTGGMNGTWRVGANYRNQWGSISAPAVYATPSAFADFKLLSGRFSGNYLGLGVLFLTDKAGDGQLTTSSAMISAAYHQSLDNSGNYHLSAGGLWGWTQKGIDLSRLDFYDEFTGTGFKPGFASLDPITNTRFAYTDLTGGIAFDAQLTDYSRFTLGAAISHIAKPMESFYGSGTGNKIGTRYSVHAGGTFGINNKIYILPYALYQLQTAAQEFVAGTAIGYNFAPSRYKPGTIIYGGLFTRMNDAYIPTVGLMMNGIQFGVSYDVNSSTLKRATGGQGGFEVAVIYSAGKPIKKNKSTFCPRF